MPPDSDLAQTHSAHAVVDTACLILCSELDLVGCSFEYWPFDALLPRIERGRILVPADTVGARSYADWTWPDGIELPVRVDGLQIGRFVLVTPTATTGVALSISDRERALDIAEGCASALALRPSEGACS